MNKLEEAYKLLDSINKDVDQEKIKEISLKAYNTSLLCIEAALVLSKLSDDFYTKEKILLDSLDGLIKEFEVNKDELIINNLIRARIELGNLYYDHGMFFKAKEIYENLENDGLNNMFVKYKLMNIYAYFEDIKIDEYYHNLIKDVNDIDFVRISFPYMIYKYKLAKLGEVKKLYLDIINKNPNITKVLKGEDDNKEALKVLKNNSLLLNTCPYLINYLESL